MQRVISPGSSVAAVAVAFTVAVFAPILMLRLADFEPDDDPLAVVSPLQLNNRLLLKTMKRNMSRGVIFFKTSPIGSIVHIVSD